MSEQKEYRYEAFISYRHVNPDQIIARKLHGYIENYRIPAAIRKATGRKRWGACSAIRRNCRFRLI